MAATAATALLLAALTAGLVLTVLVGAPSPDPSFPDATGLSWRYAACWALFGAAVWTLRRVPPRHVTALVLAGGIAVAVAGLVAPPRTSTDSFRYAWDGRVQAAGISPYDHAPADPALAALRDTWLFPPHEACRGATGPAPTPASGPPPAPAPASGPPPAPAPASGPPPAPAPASGPSPAPAPAPAPAPGLAPLPDGGCTRINRPTVHTIYPPAGEAYFLLVHAVSPAGARHKPLQTAGAFLTLATTLVLLRVLRRRGDPRDAAWWAWCPAVAVEAVNNAHADVLGVLLSVTALALTVRHRSAGGAVLGLATAVKLLPAVLLPGALSGIRRPREAAATLLPAVIVPAALYLPYVLLSDSSVLGYLGGYAQEEGYQDASSGGRYALLRLLLPDSWAVPAVLAGTAAVSLYVIRRGDPARPWSGALLVTGTVFLLTTPGYSWYALLLIALVALDGRWEWLGVALAGAAAYLVIPRYLAAGTVAYGTALLLVLAGHTLRTRRHRTRRAYSSRNFDTA
ncbi:glycosyltransferase 87 family protein [Streptomyces sp. NPDC101118]|uniref:glycosyltransferase 87 family protein n=1 Tax=Streptomyces sp. NPDC101118 TaxID=3366109 RepID=UPI00381077D3